MRAYNMCMAMIFINCGFGVVSQFGIFNLSEYTGVFSSLYTLFSNPIVIGTLVTLLVAGSGYLAATVTSDKGVAYTYFSLIFWGSFALASTIFAPICDHYNVEIFYMVYTLATVLIFVMAFIQMPTGGQKAHV